MLSTAYVLLHLFKFAAQMALSLSLSPHSPLISALTMQSYTRALNHFEIAAEMDANANVAENLHYLLLLLLFVCIAFMVRPE